MTRTIGGAALILVVLCIGGESQYQCNKKLDVIVAVDVSGSIEASQFATLRNFLKTVVDKFRISSTLGARFIFFAFDHSTNSEAEDFNDRVVRVRSLIKQQIDRLQFTAGATLITTALEEAKNFLVSSTRTDAQRVVAFVTDGVNYNGTDSLRRPAEELRTAFKARVIGLGIGPADDINIETFQVLAGRNDRHILLTFKKKNSGGDDDEDDSDCDSDDESEDEDEDESCGNSEVKTVVNLICNGQK